MRRYVPLFYLVLIYFLGTAISASFGLYEKIPQWDKVFHFLGGIAVAWFFLTTMNFSRFPPHKLFRYLLLSTLLVVILWEIAEYFSGIYLLRFSPILYHYSLQYTPSFADALGDVVTAVLGALIIARRFSPSRELNPTPAPEQ